MTLNKAMYTANYSQFDCKVTEDSGYTALEYSVKGTNYVMHKALGSHRVYQVRVLQDGALSADNVICVFHLRYRYPKVVSVYGLRRCPKYYTETNN